MATKTMEWVQEKDQEREPAVGVARLNGDGLRSLSRRGQIIRVCSGLGWITFAGKDFALQAGDQLQLGWGRDAALISSLGKQALVYVVEPAF